MSNEHDNCPRGARGPDGHRGPDGEPGPPGGGGLLKFSGVPLVLTTGPAVSYLVDNGASGGIVVVAPSYPDAVVRNLRNMAVNVTGSVVPANGSILVELIDQTMSAVPGFVIAYGPGETGVKTVVVGPAPFAIGSRFNLRITTDGLPTRPVRLPIMAATVGVE